LAGNTDNFISAEQNGMAAAAVVTKMYDLSAGARCFPNRQRICAFRRDFQEFRLPFPLRLGIILLL
jgi:hypothetical protein